MSPLRVTFLLDGWLQPHWFATALRRCEELSFVELGDIVVRAASPPSDSHSLTDRLGEVCRDAVYHLYTSLDDWYFSPLRDPHTQVDLRSFLQRPSNLQKQSRDCRGPSSLAHDESSELARPAIDVLVTRAITTSEIELPELPPYGVWRFEEDLSDESAVSPGFRPVFEGDPTSVLSIVSDTAKGRHVVFRSHTRTDPLSVSRTSENLYWKASFCLEAALSRLHASRRLPPAEPASSPPGASEHAAHSTGSDSWEGSRPGNGQMLGMMRRLVEKRLTTGVQQLTTTREWCMGFKFLEGEQKGIPRPDLSDVHLLSGPEDRYWADPCPVQLDGRHYLFLEEFMLDESRGHISVLEFDRDGTWRRPVPVLTRPYHLSYPFVFRAGDDVYMIPETIEARCIDLYRARRFPHEWEHVARILEDCMAVDPTVARIDDRWWLFTSMPDREEILGPTDELYLFYASKLEGPWTAHPLNPVKSDVRSARPAGALVESSGSLYRPAQNCARFYGHAIAINRINEISQHEYRETVVSNILPEWTPGLEGTHTLNVSDDLMVIDGFRRVSRFNDF